jgi:hypothetical protein
MVASQNSGQVGRPPTKYGIGTSVVGVFIPRLAIYHISLVMLHDVRSTDRETPAIRDAGLSPDQVQKSKRRLQQLQHPQFAPPLHGIRFGVDESVFAVLRTTAKRSP